MPIRRWDIDVGDGWFAIIDAVLAQASWQAREGGASITLADCKEKIGTLRIRFQGDVTDHLRGAADMARELSARTCWHCGDPGKPRSKSLVALCDGCTPSK